MRVSPNIACLQGRMIWGWLWLGPGWDNFRRLHSNYELNLFPASSTQDDTRMPSTFWGHCSQDDGRMIFEKFCFPKKESKKKIAVILFSRMMTTQTRMNHPKIAYHPGFMERPASFAWARKIKKITKNAYVSWWANGKWRPWEMTRNFWLPCGACS